MPKEYRFNHLEFLGSLEFDSWASVSKASLPISQFLGSFWFQVKSVHSKIQGDRVGFRLDNDTTLESGSHIVGRFRSEFTDNVEDLIEENPGLKNKPLVELIRDTQQYHLISILRSKKKGETQGSEGGGSLCQTFNWTEKRDPCFGALVPIIQLWEADLDIEPWVGYEWETQDPEGFPRW